MGAGEIPIDELGLQPNGVEYLRTAVGLKGRNPHLRHDLQHSLGDGPDIALVCLSNCESVRQLVDQGCDAVKCQVGVDGFCSVAAQQAEVVDLASLGCFDHEANFRAKSLSNEMVVDRRCRQQSRYRHPGGVHTPIGENQDVVSIANPFGGATAQPLNCLLHTTGANVRRVADTQSLRPKCVINVVLDPPNALQVDVGENGLIDLEARVRTTGVEIEQIRSWPNQ